MTDDGLMAALEAIQGIIEKAKLERAALKPDEDPKAMMGAEPVMAIEIEAGEGEEEPEEE